MIFLLSGSNDRRKQILAKLIKRGDWDSRDFDKDAF